MSVKHMANRFQNYYVKDTGIGPTVKEVVILLANPSSISGPNPISYTT